MSTSEQEQPQSTMLSANTPNIPVFKYDRDESRMKQVPTPEMLLIQHQKQLQEQQLKQRQQETLLIQQQKQLEEQQLKQKQQELEIHELQQQQQQLLNAYQKLSTMPREANQYENTTNPTSSIYENPFALTKPVVPVQPVVAVPMRGRVRLTWATFLLLSVGLILFVTGYCSPDWVTNITDGGPSPGSTSYGLWELCTNQNGGGGKNTQSPVVCYPAGEYNWLTAVQTMETLGLILLVPATIASALYLFKETMRSTSAAISTTVLALGAGVIILIGVIVCGAEISQENSKYANDKLSPSLGWSFAVVVVGGSLSTIAGVLSSVGLCIGGCAPRADRPV